MNARRILFLNYFVVRGLCDQKHRISVDGYEVLFEVCLTLDDAAQPGHGRCGAVSLLIVRDFLFYLFVVCGCEDFK